MMSQRWTPARTESARRSFLARLWTGRTRLVITVSLLREAQATRNVKNVHGIPFGRLELTQMIAINDVASEVFPLRDVDTIVAFAMSEGLGRLHH